MSEREKSAGCEKTALIHGQLTRVRVLPPHEAPKRPINARPHEIPGECFRTNDPEEEFVRLEPKGAQCHCDVCTLTRRFTDLQAEFQRRIAKFTQHKKA